MPATDGREDGGVVRLSTSVGINEIEPPNFKTHPKPVHSKFTIDVTNVTGQSISIVDLLGNTIYTGKIRNEKTEIDLSGFESGIYFVTVSSNLSTGTTRKIIVD